MYRETVANVYLKNIKYNVREIIKKYNTYEYYIGVVKADSYGHYTNKVVKEIIDGGCNYLAVSSLDEALIIRESFKDIPILCLGIIDLKYINKAIKNKIDVTVTNLDYLNKIKDYKLNIHIKIDTGMNRLGVKDKCEFDSMIKVLDSSNIKLKGLYTHIYNAKKKSVTNKQINRFKYITSDINLNEIDIIHIAQSDTLVNNYNLDICNGCRLGIIMYGLNDNKLNLKNTIDLTSKIIEIKKLKKGETLGYDGSYKAKKDEVIGIIPIGYADGINRHIKNSYVIINDKRYKIVGNICMDMMFIKIDDSIKLGDTVYVYKDINHINEISKHLNTIPYEVICSISKRVERKYIK